MVIEKWIIGIPIESIEPYQMGNYNRLLEKQCIYQSEIGLLVKASHVPEDLQFM